MYIPLRRLLIITWFECNSGCHLEVSLEYLSPQEVVSGDVVPSLATLARSDDVLVRQLSENRQKNRLRNQRPSGGPGLLVIIRFVIARTIRYDNFFRHFPRCGAPDWSTHCPVLIYFKSNTIHTRWRQPPAGQWNKTIFFVSNSKNHNSK